MSETRIKDYTDASTIFACAVGVLSIPQTKSVEALVVFPGLGDNDRTMTALGWWEHPRECSAQYLIIAGHNPSEKNQEDLTIQTLQDQPFYMRRWSNVVTQIHTENTKTQAEWVVRQLRDRNLRSCALFVSTYHIVRAYLTLLKAPLRDCEKQSHLSLVESLVAIVPVPTSPLHTLTPEVGKMGLDMIPAEHERIFRYQQRGDVATLDELMNYRFCVENCFRNLL